MKSYRLIVVLPMLLVATGRLLGQEKEKSPVPGPDKPAGLTATSRTEVTLMEDAGGNRIVAVSHPWKAYFQPSIEVCLLPPSEEQPDKVRPLYFVNRFLKGRMTVAVYHCLDKADDAPLRMPFQEADISFEILGNRNSLGKPAVCVACRTPTLEKTMLPRATFCFLEHWALQDRTLLLDLPPDYFAAAGKLKIWLLRDDTVVWSETIRWPGLPGAQAPEASSAAATAKAAVTAKASAAAQQMDKPAPPKPRPARKPTGKKQAKEEEAPEEK